MANPTELQSIEEAFAAAISKAYDTMLQGYVDANGAAGLETAANQRFERFVVLARKVRAQALKQL
ncbi:hypothetical protein ACQ859_11735 [Roseateles chitinivorans]|uniref:hypothetical protein n=1 Tax=Roseateles chitinivorans TaxID=2917965 RepID=UPI003D67FA3B